MAPNAREYLNDYSGEIYKKNREEIFVTDLMIHLRNAGGIPICKQDALNARADLKKWNKKNTFISRRFDLEEYVPGGKYD